AEDGIRDFHVTGVQTCALPIFILVSLLVIMVTGFLVEVLRIVAMQDAWAAWSPVGTATGRLLAAAGLSGFDAQLAAHRFLWWFRSEERRVGKRGARGCRRSSHK